MEQESILTLRQQYFQIVAAVSSYWIFSIALVFLNKYILSDPTLKLDAPIFVAWYQCVVAVALCFSLSWLSKMFPNHISFSAMKLDMELSREVLPLSIVFVPMIAFNNLSLKHVGLSFYYIGRSLTTVFNVAFSYLILGKTTSRRACASCLLIAVGFFLGVDQEEASGSLSVIGVVHGVLASLLVALSAIYTQRSLGIVGNDIWQLTMYNNLNACFLFLPLILVNKELGAVMYFPHLFSLWFWTLMTISGVFGFLMGYVTGWQIQVTSPPTHSISGTAKSAAQTVIAVVWWSEIKTGMWWASNFMVLLGSALYTYVKGQELKAALPMVTSPRSDAHPLMWKKTSELDEHDDRNL
ncbi:hypothetical protein PMAYCL1PPCAC_09738 [Pristionchus mayeri]|uniref:Sugar phosphate transporter domain-containing protein n=1 Tax=Pristionchus mayeri TaxID=1317129 RepID=A0AAN5C6R8_9BILA|nr:hypothetical protein PMAYCL1PPCAC_09738 [Pristionchus mayeri]